MIGKNTTYSSFFGKEQAILGYHFGAECSDPTTACTDIEYTFAVCGNGRYAAVPVHFAIAVRVCKVGVPAAGNGGHNTEAIDHPDE